MALPMMNFGQRSVDDDNPFLRGMERGQGMAQRGYQFPHEIEKIRQANIFARLQNQYYGPNIESEIGLRGAQTGLVGEQSKYYGSDIASQIAERAAHAGLLREQTLNPYKFNQGAVSMLQYLDQNPQMGQDQSTHQRLGMQAVGGNAAPGQQMGMPAPMGQGNQDMMGEMRAMDGQFQQAPQQFSQPSEGLGAFNEPSLREMIINKALLGSELTPKNQAALGLAVKEQESVIARAQAKQMANIESYKKEFEKLQSEVDVANHADAALDKAEQAYDASTYKGTGFKGGRVPSSGVEASARNLLGSGHDFSPEQDFDQAANDLVTAMAQGFGSGNATAPQLEAISNAKISRKMDRAAFENTKEYFKNLNTRKREELEFKTLASHMGIDPDISSILFTKYVNDLPITGKDIKDVRPYLENTYRQYFRPDVIQNVVEGRKPNIITYKEIERIAKERSLPVEGVVHYLREQGKL